MTTPEEMDERIRKLKESSLEKEWGEPKRNNGLSIAMRMGIELVSAVAVGCVIGYQLDKWLDTKPWFFLICFLIGCAAGGVTVYRTAQHIRTDDE
jgi:ATP synthase protein I